MLIRSQDKLKIVNLQNVDTIAVSKSDDFERKSYSVYSFNGADDSVTTLGTYSTEEKAIKVLDMIQKMYCDCIEAKGHSFYFAIDHPKVFQMPQDEEVQA